MNIWLDPTLSPRLARALADVLTPPDAAGHLRDVLGHDASDVHVADFLAAHPGSTVIGIDLDIAEQPHRLAVWRARPADGVLLTPAWLDLAPLTQAWMLIRRIEELRKKIDPAHPAIWHVPPVNDGRIRKLR